MKIKALILVLIPLLVVSCDSLFDKGDVEKKFSGPAQIEFKPLQQEANQNSGSFEVAIQLIGKQRGSDLTVSFSVDGSSTAVDGTHYTLPSSSATIASGTSTATVTINLIDGNLASGEEVTLMLNLEDAGEVTAAPNLDQSTTFIFGS
ncbi:Calx-beta domain-containing protein [Gracilimonas sp. BCB1]|uniref:Calx-beta domain-containing protein n=1 Tax=Gracilimonas sp. BCB1 TaxID=3152362 RepID=UPI0032D92EC8